MKKDGFPRSIRIKKESEFRQIVKDGAKNKGDNLVVFRLLDSAEKGQRFGIKIGKGIKKATDRNKIKRTIREFLRKSKDRFGKNESVVVLCKSTAAGIYLGKLREEMVNLIHKTKNQRT